ncbi:hypothetical protein [Pseudoalteromonas sp. NBT06-2]|uniref:hypothetical protein n=1 Tax=Pseudoalteromonas sp. NBT06-2 TaxID=2025950 RepID=UPI0011409E07|nr:hypothetical protein [Pseudoalteromonas sp. NBT06-2]
MENVFVQFTDTSLQIPKKVIIGNLPKSVVSEDGLDEKTDEISLKVPLMEIGIGDSIGQSLMENVIILIGSSGNMNVSQDAKDALTGKGLYKNRVVSKDPTLDFYRVYSKSGHPKIWHYVKTDSGIIDESSPWIGSCTVGPLEDEKKDLSNVKCNAKSSYKDVVFQYTTSAKYFSSTYELELLIVAKLKEWDTSGIH